MTAPAPRVGVVVIGRNEGDRLRRCLDSVLPVSAHVVYVDSGSTDGSAEAARARGADVVELDMSIPFCAARARNVGYQRLMQRAPELRFVQFIDGDCEIEPDWLANAVDALEAHPAVAIVAGWLRERSPEVSVYNRIGDVQWNIAGAGAGGGDSEVDTVGGIFTIRSEAFAAVGGFDNTVAAGEEPELCRRLMHKGWKIVRLDHGMARHDLAMTRFGQWWKRQIRSGYGGADVAQRFALPQFRRNNMRILVWSAWLVLVAALAAWSIGRGDAAVGVLCVAVAALWPVQVLRIASQIRRKRQPAPLSLLYATFLMISFWPQLIGQVMYWNDRWHKRTFRLVEYKAPGSSGR